jgi:probable rRNA maturation factor
MAKIALSIRTNSGSIIKDSHTGTEIDLQSTIPWASLADKVFQITFKPYFMNQEVVLSFCEPDEIQQLNSLYRNINQVTDVLSFNAIGNTSVDLFKFEDLVDKPDLDPEDAALGDVIICVQKAQLQAKEQNKALKDELAMLFVHGLLHLLGYDHETRDEALEMFKLQELVLNHKFEVRESQFDASF